MAKRTVWAAYHNHGYDGYGPILAIFDSKAAADKFRADLGHDPDLEITEVELTSLDDLTNG
jgi:hypothetical protein